MPSPYPAPGRPLIVKTHLADRPSTHGILTGEIVSPLLTLDICGPKSVSKGFKPLVREQAFDASELSMMTFLQAKAYGKPLVLLPAVVLGRFQHGFLACSAASDINALPGEWKLFCLHLEAGGYGSEFVKLRSLVERRGLTQQIASGSQVTLARIRPREPGPFWWRSLTLDPESLVAPWARPRPFRPRPEVAAYLKAFEAMSVSGQQLSLLRSHAEAPRRTATMRALAKAALGTDSPKTTNLLYGNLARQLTSLLEWEPDRRKDGSPIWMSLVAEGWYPPGREYEWTMVPSAAEAVRDWRA